MKRTVGNNEWLDIDVLDDYLEGKLEASMMHRVERISLEDPFVAQALAGLTEAKKRTQTLSFLQKQLQERVAEKPVERKMWRMASHRLSIAATAAVLFLTVSVLFWLRENHRQQQAELAKNSTKNIEVDLKSEDLIAVAPVDTIVAKKTETALDQQKVAEALNQTLAKGSQVIAKNNAKEIVAAESPALAYREVQKSRLKKEVNENQAKMVGAQIAVPTPPVQTLESRVEGIQVKTDLYAKSVKGTVYDIYGRPLPGIDVKMVGDDLRSITNKSGEFALPINKDSNKVTLEVASLGFVKKNVEAKANEKLNIRLEESASALNEVAVINANGLKRKPATENAKMIDSPIVLASRVAGLESVTPIQGWKAVEDYLKNNNKLFKDGKKVVNLQFIVKKDGSVANIKLVKGQTDEMNKEAIRLLTEGPKWQYKPKGNNLGMIYIKF